MKWTERKTMKLWSFKLTITRRDQILTEIDATLQKAGVTQSGTTGVQILADKLRAADTFAQGVARRVFELEQSIKEYERVFQQVQLAERAAKAREQDEATPIERLARASSGIDLPQTQRTPVYRPDRLALPVMPSDPPPLPSAAGVAETRRERIALTQPESDKEA